MATTHASAPRQDAEETPGWRFDIEPYVWLPSTTGTGTTDTTPPVSIDTVGALDAALPLAIGAHSPDRRFMLLADGFYVRFEDDEGPLQTTTEATMVEVGGGMALDANCYFSALAGVRYVDISYDVTVGNLEGSAGASWVDPWVGGRIDLPLSETFAVRLRGDVGGFGIGTDVSWQTMAFLATTLGGGVTIDFGYRAIGLDYDSGGLTYDAVFHGPIIGLAVTF